ncbi:type I-E CRISPR-associated protein Cas6/Cse3/CasE [Corynebacterium striatum]
MSTLTKLYLNPLKRDAAKLLANPQAMHAAVRGAFPPDIDESQSRVLWRVDHREHEHVLYIVGPEKPDAQHIVEQAGWGTRPAQSADYSRFLEQIVNGQKWAFELVGNPVESITIPGKSRGKVVPHVTAAQQCEWLLKKSMAAGFSIAVDENEEPMLSVVERNNLRFSKRDGAKRVSLRTARFRGQLVVTNAKALNKSLQQGIGRARAYGCGLLTLAPAE